MRVSIRLLASSLLVLGLGLAVRAVCQQPQQAVVAAATTEKKPSQRPPSASDTAAPIPTRAEMLQGADTRFSH